MRNLTEHIAVLLTATFVLHAKAVADDQNKPASLHDDVRATAPALRASATLADYQTSRVSPAEIVERIHVLESRAAWIGLCTELSQLADSELELFEDEIRKSAHARYLPCHDKLVKRLTAHWSTATQRLASAHPFPVQVSPMTSEIRVMDATKEQVITDGHLSMGEIALTFDDGPHPTRTPRILQILANAGIKANFFEIGRNAVAHPEIAKMVVTAGHIVGSHTWSHPDLKNMEARHAETEIDSGEASVALALGNTTPLSFFRFPYGSNTATEQRFVQHRGYTTFFWNMDSQDWKIRDPHKLFLNVLAQLDHAGRGIILFHDIHEQTVIVLPHVIAELRARNFKTVLFIPKAGTNARVENAF